MKMYEFITPSDPITFKAEDDKIAYVCTLIIGGGKAGCKNLENGESLPTMLFMAKDPEKDIADFMGCKIKDYIEKNRVSLAECFGSFAYGDATDRKTYDAAIEAITDEEKLKQFKAKHEDSQRTSMSGWVKYAWDYKDSMLKKIKETNESDKS